MPKASSVDDYQQQHPRWESTLRQLISVLRSSALQECLKWGAPCYTLQGKNLISIVAFKQHVALWFHQGALLTDPAGKLHNAQEGKTQALRQWHFTDDSEIDVALILDYVQESIALQKAGKRVTTRQKPLVIPTELEAAFAERPDLHQQFEQLSLSKQREFADYVSEAKRADTRLRRVEKVIAKLAQGLGLHDQYRT